MSDTSSIEQCSVGKRTMTACHKSSYTQKTKITSMESLTSSEKQILSQRCGVNIDLLTNICEHHKIFYFKKYELHQTSCFDPFKCHKKKITKALRKISLDFSEEINKFPILVKSIPGQKICGACREKIQKHYKSSTNAEKSDDTESDNDRNVVELEASYDKSETLASLNSSLADIGESPIKFHSISSHSRSSYAKRKLDSACSNFKNKVNKVLETEISPTKSLLKLPPDVQQKVSDMDSLINMIKIKLETAITRREKIQLLTLAPSSWSKKRIMEEFHVSEYAVRQARELLKDKGILALPEPRKGKTLNENTIRLIQDFYQNDENSRIMPGKKDFVSISRNTHMQKRLLLCNLKELYSAFKSEYSFIKIGFSKFCMLRPKWCVFAGSAGTHSICVCSIHENVNLLLSASNIEEPYSDLISHMVCSTEKRDCMLRHCSNCPSNEKLKKLLLEKFEEYDPDDEITYSQWVSTDRTELVRCTATCDEYVSKLLEKLEKLIPHSFISKQQSNFLKQMKNNCTPDIGIVILDFSENYSYLIQNEAQGYHWTNNSCSLHPAVIYTSDPESLHKLRITSMCIISNDLDHDVAFVYETQKEIIHYIKEHFPTLQKIIYFSDGCSGQYKNCKNFRNLCKHKEEFSLEASWAFFATSHGKSPCDGIGGTIKRLVSRESLQSSPGNAINTVEMFFDFCKSNINNIIFKLIRKEVISETRRELADRFSRTKTIPGTRSFHHFIPLSNESIGAKRISLDEDFSLIFNFKGQNSSYVDFSQLTANSYVACIYDNHWFFGLVLSKEEEERDIKVKFMHPYGPARSFYWPPEQKDDICYIPISHVIASVSPPTTKGSGRMYYFEEKEVLSVQKQFDLFLQSNIRSHS